MGKKSALSQEDEIAFRARRKSTLQSLKLKRKLRIKQIKEDAAQKIQEVNILYAKDPDRLRAKYAADEFARNQKAQKRAQKLIEREKRLFDLEQKLRPYTLGEEIFSAIVEGLGVFFFIAATVLLDVLALERMNTPLKTPYFVVYTIFGSIMIFNYLFSTLHHAIPNGVAKEVFKRFCHAGVFLTIAAGFAAYSLVDLMGLDLTVLVLNGVAAALCLTGLLMYCIAGTRFETANIVFYGVLSVAGFFMALLVFKTVSRLSFWWLVGSGVFYILGLVFCALRKIKFMHAIGNLLLLAASVSLFVSLFYIQQ